VPSPYSRYVFGAAFTCVAEKPVIAASEADVPQEADDAINLT
jgi:hypothetical protein